MLIVVDKRNGHIAVSDQLEVTDNDEWYVRVVSHETMIRQRWTGEMLAPEDFDTAVIWRGKPEDFMTFRSYRRALSYSLSIHPQSQELPMSVDRFIDVIKDWHRLNAVIGSMTDPCAWFVCPFDEPQTVLWVYQLKVKEGMVTGYTKVDVSDSAL